MSRCATLGPAWRRAAEQRRQRRLTQQQLRLRCLRSLTPRTRRDYLRRSRWWVLEASRGYPSAPESRRYALNMRWAAELAALHGPGTWLELIDLAGAPNPEAGGAR